MNISRVKARWVLDSRGRPTVYSEVHAGKCVGWAIAPSGASTGKKEAVELRDGGKAFGGYGVENAVENVNTAIADALIGMDVKDQQQIDSKMLEVDGTAHKERLGANATISVSMASLKCASCVENTELYDYVSKVTGEVPAMPKPMFNVINGGEHAGNSLAVQEFLIVPGFDNIEENVKAAQEIYLELKKMLLEKFGKSAINVGDEGGFAPPLGSTTDALEILSKAIDEAGYLGKAEISLDAAANSFFKEGKYFIDGGPKSDGELLDHYVSISKSYGILSIEDPFEEGSPGMFKMLKEKKVCKVIGDDLTVTDVNRLERFHECIDGLIIKPNQIGTVSETLLTIQKAKELAPMMIGSHRSGDSEDTFIADFAVGCALPYVKFGAPARGERTCKYNRLLKIGDDVESRGI